MLDAAAQGFRVVHVKAGVNAALVDLTLTGSYDTINAVAASGRRAQESGQDAIGVFNEGNMTIRGSTIADFRGGGVQNTGHMTISGATIAENGGVLELWHAEHRRAEQRMTISGATIAINSTRTSPAACRTPAI